MIQGAPRRPTDGEPNGREPDFSEDDLARGELGPTTGDSQSERDRMTPQRRKKTPGDIDPGHPA